MTPTRHGHDHVTVTVRITAGKKKGATNQGGGQLYPAHPATAMAAQAKLMAALKKNADDDDAPKPDLTPIVPTSDDRQAVKLRKTNLLGTVTWEQAIEKLQLNLKHDFAELAATVQKMFGNVLANPGEAKFRKVRYSNPNFGAKLWSLKGGPEIFEVSVSIPSPSLPPLGSFSRYLSRCTRMHTHTRTHEDQSARRKVQLCCCCECVLLLLLLLFCVCVCLRARAHTHTHTHRWPAGKRTP